MSLRAGNLLDLGQGRKAHVVWARPPVYFCAALPDANGALPDLGVVSSGDSVTHSRSRSSSRSSSSSSSSESASGGGGGGGGVEVVKASAVRAADLGLPLGLADQGAKVAGAACLRVTVGSAKLGRTFDYLDRPLDGLGPLAAPASPGADGDVTLPVFNLEPEKGSTRSVTRGLHSGVVAVDALTPIGRGQTMLIVGGNGVGRGQIALDVVQAQGPRAFHRGASTGDTSESGTSGGGGGMPCVWACLWGGGAALRAELAATGSLAHVAIVEAPEGSSASQQAATAAAALAVRVLSVGARTPPTPHTKVFPARANHNSYI